MGLIRNIPHIEGSTILVQLQMRIYDSQDQNSGSFLDIFGT